MTIIETFMSIGTVIGIFVTALFILLIFIKRNDIADIAHISPFMITFLIIKLSGIPMLEKRFEGNPAFEAYKDRTNAFFFFPPKT